MGQARNNNHNNEIWKYGDGQIAIYTENPAIWARIKRSYSHITQLMGEYWHKGNQRPHAMQYLAPIGKRRTFEKMLGVKMQIY